MCHERDRHPDGRVLVIGGYLDFVAALPKNAYGEILERELREPYWAGRGRRV
jgi:hypothetical protein